MATITKRATGYQAQVRRKGYPPVSKVFSTKKDAEVWARELEAEMDRGAYLDRSEAERTTFGGLLDRYLREITPSKKGADVEAIRIKRFLRDEKLCQYKASALSGRVLAAWRDNRLKEVSGSTANRELNLLSHVITVARKEWGIHISNPVEAIQRPRSNKGRERRLTREEEQELLAAFDKHTRNPWIKSVVVFAIETGMRRGEILSLVWAHVDLQKRVVRLLDSKNGEGRSVPLTSKAASLLAALPRSIDGRVFPITAKALEMSFGRVVERSGVHDFHFHDLRHEAISRFFERGLNVMEVASISGHKTLQMLKRYTHISSDSLLQKIG